jgi:hypothetical protein
VHDIYDDGLDVILLDGLLRLHLHGGASVGACLASVFVGLWVSDRVALSVSKLADHQETGGF